MRDLADSRPLLATLYHRHLLASFEKQLRLEHSVSEATSWEFNLPRGQLLVRGADWDESPDVWSCQILGTEDEQTGTWLWAWANTASNIPSALLTDAERLRQFGQEHKLAEFAQPRVALDGLDGHVLCLIASAVCPFDAYFRLPHSGGAVFVSLHDSRLRREHRSPIGHALGVISQAVASPLLSAPRLAICEYLKFLGLNIQEQQNALVATDGGTPVLRITFDEQDRVIKITALVGDTSAPGPPDESFLPAFDEAPGWIPDS